MKNNLKMIITLVITAYAILFIVGCVQKPTGNTIGTIGENTLLKVIQEEKLIVGVLPDYLPLSSLSSEGSFEGYDVDIAKLLGEELGVNVEIIAVDALNRIASLVSGKVDIIIAGITPTNERAKTVTFSIPYASVGGLALLVNDKNINSYEDMVGKTIAVTRGETQDLYGTAKFTDSEFLRFDTLADTYSGKTDSLVERHDYMELKNNPRKHKIVGKPFAKGLLYRVFGKGIKNSLTI